MHKKLAYLVLDISNHTAKITCEISFFLPDQQKEAKRIDVKPTTPGRMSGVACDISKYMAFELPLRQC